MTVVVQEGHGPVPDDHAQPERGGVSDGERIEPPVEGDVLAGPTHHTEPELTTWTIAGRQRKTGEDDDGCRERGDVGRAPVEPRLCERDDRDREPPAPDTRGPVEALRGRGADRGAHVVAARDES